jgi:sec-independent protein translocase protein TatB
MFDIGFSEIVVIAVVALIVIGPERLPKAARTLGHLFGRLQRYVNDVKADINREIELDELRKLQREVQTAASDLKSSVESAAQGVESGVRDVERDLNAGAYEDAPPQRPPEPAALLNEPGGEVADAAPAEAPRQGALPGFDRI